MSDTDAGYLCVGICMADPDSGYCLGCGRPPEPALPGSQGIIVEVIRREPITDRLPNNDAPNDD